MKYDIAMELVDSIEEYLEHECDSHQEALQLMCQLAGYPDYIDDKFYDHLIEKLQEELQMYKDHTEIVERTETITITHQELVWDDR